MIKQMDRCLCCGQILGKYDASDLTERFCCNIVCPLHADDVETNVFVDEYYIDKIKQLWLELKKARLEAK